MAQPPDWLPTNDQATIWVTICGVIAGVFGVRGRQFRGEIKAEQIKLWDEIRTNRVSADTKHDMLLSTVASKHDVARLDDGIKEVRQMLLSAARRRQSD